MQASDQQTLVMMVHTTLSVVVRSPFLFMKA